jgi:3-oxoadipate enol-lactonase
MLLAAMAMKRRVNDITIAYDDQGSGLPVVLLHAFPLSRAMWEPQATALVQTGRYRVIRPDFRGFGESDVVAQPSTMEQLAADTLGLLDQLGISNFVLGGLSMGGYVAFAIYRARPQAVRALMLADTRPQPDTPEGKAGRETTAQMAEREGSAAIAVDWVMRFFPPRVTVPANLPERVRQIILSNDPRGIAAAARGMGLRPDSRPTLPAITCPTLIIVGEHDSLTPVSDAQTMAEGIRQAQLAIIPHAGHLANLEQPVAFNQVLLAFLESLPSASD